MWPSGQIVTVRKVTQQGFEGRHVVSRAITSTEFAFPEIAAPALARWVQRQTAAAKARR